MSLISKALKTMPGISKVTLTKNYYYLVCLSRTQTSSLIWTFDTNYMNTFHFQSYRAINYIVLAFWPKITMRYQIQRFSGNEKRLHKTEWLREGEPTIIQVALKTTPQPHCRSHHQSEQSFMSQQS